MKKTKKLSGYTIAKNCTDINDVEQGIKEIRQYFDDMQKKGKKIPDYLYRRYSELLNKHYHFVLMEENKNKKQKIYVVQLSKMDGKDFKEKAFYRFDTALTYFYELVDEKNLHNVEKKGNEREAGGRGYDYSLTLFEQEV